MITILNPTSYTPGPAIHLCQREDLDAFDPNWPMAAQSNIVENFTYDEQLPSVCYVYPPPGSACYVELSYIEEPVDCVTTASNIALISRYAQALRYMTLSIAYEKDIEGANPERAKFYLDLAIQALTLGDANDKGTSPNATEQDGKITRTGKA